MGKSGNLAVAAAALALVTAQLAGLARPVRAQDYPSRPIRVLIAFPPGGPTDFVGRLLVDKMSALLGQRVYIENKPGANGTVGADIIAKADPDGYSLFLTTAGAVTISPHVMANIPYDSLRDFVPVAEVVTNTTVLVVTPKMAIKTAKELVALAKQKPGAITFGSTGIGSTTHLAQVLLADAAGVSFLHVPYRGAAPMLTDLLGGQGKAPHASRNRPMESGLSQIAASRHPAGEAAGSHRKPAGASAGEGPR